MLGWRMAGCAGVGGGGWRMAECAGVGWRMGGGGGWLSEHVTYTVIKNMAQLLIWFKSVFITNNKYEGGARMWWCIKIGFLSV